jgi:predicted Zn-ribbon and HTH transcriptional regulator
MMQTQIEQNGSHFRVLAKYLGRWVLVREVTSKTYAVEIKRSLENGTYNYRSLMNLTQIEKAIEENDNRIEREFKAKRKAELDELNENVLAVLNDSPTPLTIQEIQETVNLLFEKEHVYKSVATIISNHYKHGRLSRTHVKEKRPYVYILASRLPQCKDFREKVIEVLRKKPVLKVSEIFENMDCGLPPDAYVRFDDMVREGTLIKHVHHSNITYSVNENA